MKTPLKALVLSAVMAALAAGAAHAGDKKDRKKDDDKKPEWSIVIHGGAGIIERAQMDPQTEAAYRAALAKALETGSKVLRDGGTSLDAIEATIHLLEDDPLFNAGRGAVFTAEGKNELDAAIMDGSNLKAGAVAGVTTVRHPISLARAVMDNSKHVMLIGKGAEAFAADQKLEIVDPSYFFTERRWKQLVTELTKQGLPIPPRPAGAPAPNAEAERAPLDERKFGTVGVVAYDKNGNLAAGTSTGGTTAKRWGRVGDTPIIGAGTYASNDSCAVSATGTGEYFIRLTVAREICALDQYEGMSLQEAADEVIQKRLTALGGDGGIIAIGRKGEIAWSFNTPGMYRASAASNREPVVAIFKDER
ncbi:isoaspartyl peptidase/L-asparaginase [Caulobacter sp. 17J65-9]|uniref:isoaspartyl peptidase/L-asparaginase family protein n=1 Tax=Caulobacter sp. 17J65-9 TaxID=2709382 RepID=UPI001F09335C|nr:isoaspartyl peptidase/L-asparaginase [Caulobacter sp. 17J65-9]